MKIISVKNALWKMGWITFLIIILTGGETAFALNVRGTITKMGAGEKITGEIRWQSSAKAYSITIRDNIIVQVALREVADIKVEEPSNLRAIIKRVKTQPGSVIANLEEIVNAYAMLQWDVFAGRWLAEAYLQTKQAKKAVETCEKIMRDARPAQITSDLVNIYWDALFQCRMYDKLRSDLTKRIEEGDRETVAIAQIKRGDIDMTAGDFEKALLDGYLRTITLFRSVKSVQPEALYKAMKCFEALGQQTHAAKMRKILLAEFPENPYSNEAKSGL